MVYYKVGMRKKHIDIYHSRAHLFVTFLFIVVPFVFLLSFAHIAHIDTATLFYDIFISCVRLAIAYCVAVFIAWVGAMLFYRGRTAAIVLPLFDVLQSFPTFALLPLAILVWGASNTTIIFFLVITVVWPIFFSIVSSLKLIKNDWEEAVEMSGLSGTLYLKHFLIPISIPGLITGSVIGLGEGWEALVATEIITKAPRGLGSFFTLYQQNPTITALGILGLLLIIFSLNRLVWLPLLELTHSTMEE